MGLFVFGLIWTVFTSFFLYFGVSTFHENWQRSKWPQAKCEVKQLVVKDLRKKDPIFQAKAKFQYQWQGKTYTGKKVWAKKLGEDDYEDLGELLQRHRQGELKQCYVNPEDPEDACLILDENGVWSGLGLILFAGCFVAIGVALMAVGLTAKRKKKAALSSASDKDGKVPLLLAVPFCTLFGGAGIAVLIFAVLPQWQQYFAAQKWQETPATVVWSQVESHRGDDSTTYSVNIFYRYEVEGQKYRSNSGGLFSGSSSGREGKQKIVDQNPRGTSRICYVNPEKPWQALLEREMGWVSWLFTLLPLPFMAIGFGGLWWLLKSRLKVKAKDGGRGFDRAESAEEALGRQTSSLRHQTNREDVYHRNSDPRHHSAVGGAAHRLGLAGAAEKMFSPGGSRLKDLLLALFIAAFWNGIVSIFVNQALKSYASGNSDWFLILFLIPFVLIGLAMLVFVFYQFLSLFNPSPKLIVAPGILTLGEPVKVSWEIPSRAQRLQKFTIYLLGEESAEYRRGTDTVTDTQVFYEQVIVQTTSSMKARRGTVELMVPFDTMPSWEAKHNAIKWQLIVQGDIHFWPDVKDAYTVELRPPIYSQSH